jgi:hypothetical protein
MTCPMRIIVFNNYLDKLYADAHFDSIWATKINVIARKRSERGNLPIKTTKL